jgi:hypothetical protein
MELLNETSSINSLDNAQKLLVEVLKENDSNVDIFMKYKPTRNMYDLNSNFLPFPNKNDSGNKSITNMNEQSISVAPMITLRPINKIEKKEINFLENKRLIFDTNDYSSSSDLETMFVTQHNKKRKISFSNITNTENKTNNSGNDKFINKQSTDHNININRQNNQNYSLTQNRQNNNVYSNFAKHKSINNKNDNYEIQEDYADDALGVDHEYHLKHNYKNIKENQNNINSNLGHNKMENNNNNLNITDNNNNKNNINFFNYNEIVRSNLNHIETEKKFNKNKQYTNTLDKNNLSQHLKKLSDLMSSKEKQLNNKK